MRTIQKSTMFLFVSPLPYKCFGLKMDTRNPQSNLDFPIFDILLLMNNKLYSQSTVFCGKTKGENVLVN